MAKRCVFTKKDGSKCNAFPITGSDYCFNHDPNCREQKRQAVIAGGQQKKKPKVAVNDIKIGEIKDVIPLINQCINELRQGDMPPKVSNAIGYLINIALDALKITDIETRLKEVENAIKLRKRD